MIYTKYTLDVAICRLMGHDTVSWFIHVTLHFMWNQFWSYNMIKSWWRQLKVSATVAWPRLPGVMLRSHQTRMTLMQRREVKHLVTQCREKPISVEIPSKYLLVFLACSVKQTKFALVVNTPAETPWPTHSETSSYTKSFAFLFLTAHLKHKWPFPNKILIQRQKNTTKERRHHNNTSPAYCYSDGKRLMIGASVENFTWR